MNFDFMIGFDQFLSLDIGRITMELLTIDNDAVITTSLASGLCDYEHPGLPIAEKDVNAIFGDDFTMVCPKLTETFSITGNKLQSSYSSIKVKFTRCQDTDVITCLDERSIENFINNARLVMFAPRNHLLAGDLKDKPVYQEYVKVFEEQLSTTFLKQ